MASKPRFRSFKKPQGFEYGSFYNQSTGILSKYEGLYESDYEDGFMRDYVTSNWRALIARGIPVNTPMSYLHEWKHDGGGNIHVVRNDKPTQYYWKMTNFYATRWWWNDTPVNKVITGELKPVYYDRSNHHRVRLECLSKVDKTPYEFMEDILEIKETLGFISGHFLGMARILRKMHKYKAKLAKQMLKAGKDDFITVGLTSGANAWLAYRYALRPIWLSANNLSLAIDNRSSTQPKRRIARAWRADSGNLRSNCRHTWTNQPGIFRDFEQTLDYNWSVRAGIIYEVLNPYNDFQYKFGVRPKDWPIGLYNILPFTFVLEWFISFEKSLKALINLTDPNIKIITGWVTTKEENTMSTKLVDFTVASGWSALEKNADTMYTHKKTRGRSVWHPSILDALPIPELRLDFLKVADLAAINVQLLRTLHI